LRSTNSPAPTLRAERLLLPGDGGMPWAWIVMLTLPNGALIGSTSSNVPVPRAPPPLRRGVACRWLLQGRGPKSCAAAVPVWISPCSTKALRHLRLSVGVRCKDILVKTSTDERPSVCPPKSACTERQIYLMISDMILENMIGPVAATRGLCPFPLCRLVAA
jgi:hypothetical protein